MKKILSLLLVLVLLGGIVGCGRKTNDADDTSEQTETEKYVEPKYWSTTVISMLKSDNYAMNYIKNEIADYFGLKFFYEPDYGTFSASEYLSSGDEYASWRVEIQGNISGYTDDYKTIFKSKQKFKAIVDVRISRGDLSVDRVKMEFLRY